MREEVQMKKALEIIDGFTNQTPLHKYMKQYFYQNKQMGSFDRKLYNALVYNFFRLKGKRNVSNKEEMVVAGSLHEKIAEYFTHYWVNIFSAKQISLKQYLEFAQEEYFPALQKVSDSIDKQAFLKTHLLLPNIWIRIRQGSFSVVLDELKFKKFRYAIVEKNVLSFDQHHALDKMTTYAEGLFEIQDIASQKIQLFLNPYPEELWWDCCAGSGGKSLLLKELEPSVKLIVSDKRESILKNLSVRFFRNRIQQYQPILIDLEDHTNQAFLKLPEFDGIIADVPCTGSGTWGRTPEWLSYFQEEMIEIYVQKQRNLIEQAIKKLKIRGSITYITCSVFADENENNLKWMVEHLPLHLEFQKYLQFSAEKGDTLFVARLIKK